MKDASWVIIENETGKAVMEIFDFELCQFVNLDKYHVVSIFHYLVGLNQ